MILKITYQIEVIGFYQTFNPNTGTGEYTWNRCYSACYTCNEDICILCLILFITTKLYVLYSIKKNDKKTNKAYGKYKIVLDKNSITVSINNDKISYKYKDIYKFKQKKHSFFIRTKEDKIGLRFNDKLLNKEDYDKLLDYIKQVVK